MQRAAGSLLLGLTLSVSIQARSGFWEHFKELLSEDAESEFSDWAQLSEDLPQGIFEVLKARLVDSGNVKRNRKLRVAFTAFTSENAGFRKALTGHLLDLVPAGKRSFESTTLLRALLFHVANTGEDLISEDVYRALLKHRSFREPSDELSYSTGRRIRRQLHELTDQIAKTTPERALEYLGFALSQQELKEQDLSDWERAFREKIAQTIFEASSRKDFGNSLARRLIRSIPAGDPSAESRTLLRALLVHVANAEGSLIGMEVYEALLKHRGFNEPSGNSRHSLRSRIREQLKSLTGRFAATEADPNESLAYLETALELLECKNGRVSEWDRGFLRQIAALMSAPRFLQKLSATSSALQDFQQALLRLHRNLDRAHPDEVVGTGIEGALLRHLERRIHLWSRAFEGWHRQEEGWTDFDPQKASDAEAKLRHALEALGDFLDPETVAAYRDWISLLGGWENSRQDRPLDEPPELSWERDWNDAAKGAKKLNLLQAIPVYAWVRLHARLLDPDWEGAMPTPVSSLKLTDEGRLKQLGKELLSASENHLAMLGMRFDGENLEFGGSGHDSLLPRRVVGRLTDGGVHPDHKAAMRITLGAFFVWRADIAYPLGPKFLPAPLDKSEVDNVKRFYDFAKRLLQDPYLESSSWVVGLGLFGRDLEIGRDAFLQECELRLESLAAGQDWMGNDWPEKWVDPDRRNLSRSLALNEILQEQILESRQLEGKLKKSREKVRAQRKREAARWFYLRKEEWILKSQESALQRESLRLRVAEARKRETEHNYHAGRAALMAELDERQARKALLAAAKLESRRARSMLTSLSDNVAELYKESLRLSEDLSEAETQLGEFEQRAVEAQERNRRSFLAEMIRGIVRTVSFFATGYDLLAAGETIFAVSRAIERGDLSATVEAAFTGANQVPGGKVGKYAEDQLTRGQGQLTTIVYDTLGEAYAFLERLPRPDGVAVDPARTKDLGARIVGQQLSRIGLSFLAEKTHLDRIAEKLEIEKLPVEVDQLEKELGQLADSAFESLPKVAYNSLHEQGPQVLAGAMLVLGTRALADRVAQPTEQPQQLRTEIEQKFSDELASDPRQFETKLVNLIGRIKEDVPNADLGNLKSELLRERNQILGSIQRIVDKRGTLGLEVEHIERVLIELLRETENQEEFLPPILLPKEVLDLRSDFLRNAEAAGRNFRFLASPEDQDRVINQLVHGSPQLVQEVVGKLRTGLADARQNIGDAKDVLKQMKTALGKTQIEQRLYHFQSEVAHWREMASKASVRQRVYLLSAAAQADLALKQQASIGQLDLTITENQIRAQKAGVEGRRLEWSSAQDDLSAAETELKNVESEANQSKTPETNLASLRESQIRLLGDLNRRLVQRYQLVNLFEFRLKNRIFARYQPNYLLRQRTELNYGFDVLEEARREKLSQGYQVLSSYPTDKLSRLLEKDAHLREAVGSQYVLQEGGLHKFPYLILEGSKDLGSLLSGITFAVQPLVKPKRWIQEGEAESHTTSQVDGDCPQNHPHCRLEWDDLGVYRVRLVGVYLEMDPDPHASHSPTLRLKQHRDPWVRLDANQGLVLPLPAEEGKEDKGLLLQPGHLLLLETRPLFATYTVSIDEKAAGRVDRREFRTALHFIAVGVPE